MSSSKPLDRTTPSAPGLNADDLDLDNTNTNPTSSSSSSYALLQLSSLASLNNLVELSSGGDPSSSLGSGGGSLPPVPILGAGGQSTRGRRTSPPHSGSRGGVLEDDGSGTGVASTSTSTNNHSGKRTNAGGPSTPAPKRKRTNGRETKGKDNNNSNVDVDVNGDGGGGTGGLWAGVDPTLGRGSGSTSNLDMGFDASIAGAEGGQGKKRRMEGNPHEHSLGVQDHDRSSGQGGGYPNDEPDLTSGLGGQQGQGQVGSRGDASMNMGMGMEVTMDQATRHATMNMGSGMDLGGGGGAGGSGGEEGAEGAESGGDKKSKRAEQNRKAQQAFRRRREEKMKELEIKAKEMERLNRAIEDGLRRVGEVEAMNEASRMETRMLRSVVMMLASRLDDTTTSTFLDDQGDFILPLEDEVGVTACSNVPATETVMPGLDLASTAPSATPAVDEQTAEEVVRNLLNVSNELTGVTLAVMEGASGGSAVGAAGTEGVDQSSGSGDKVRLALDRLRDRSRVIAQASDMQRRQGRDPSVGQSNHTHTQADSLQQHHPDTGRNPDPSVTMIVSVDGHQQVVQGESAWKSLAQLDVLDRIITGGSNWSTHPAQFNTVIADESTLRLLPEQVNKLRREVAVVPGEAEYWSIDGLTATVSDLDRAVASLRYPGTSKTLYLCSSSRQCQEAMARSFIDRVLLVRNTAKTALSDGVDGVLHDLKEPGWTQAGRDEVSEFVGFDVGSDEDGQRGQYEMWTRQR